MTIIQSIVYGIVQGLTEFIPVSSTAHLRLVPAFFQWPDPGSAFTAIIQLGTVVAALIYFWKDLAAALKGWIGSFSGDKTSVEARTGWAVFYATLPICVIGLLIHKYIEGPFRSLWVIGSSLIVMGVVMYLADKGDKFGRTLDKVEPADGVRIGLWQCLALIPGMSRSGSTISGALIGGFDRAAAARLSFLMSIPAVTLAGFYEGFKDIQVLKQTHMVTPTIVAAFVSFVVGYACISWLIKLLSSKGTRPFVAYRIALGALILILCAIGKLNPTAPVDTEKSDAPSQISTTSV